jgi:hypothetical protein
MSCSQCGAPCQDAYCRACGRDQYRDPEARQEDHEEDKDDE